MPLPRHVANGAAGQRQADQGENKGNHVAEARIWNLHAPFGRETSTGAQRVRRNAASFQPFSGEEAARKLTPAVNRTSARPTQSNTVQLFLLVPRCSNSQSNEG